MFGIKEKWHTELFQILVRTTSPNCSVYAAIYFDIFKSLFYKEFFVIIFSAISGEEGASS